MDKDIDKKDSKEEQDEKPEEKKDGKAIETEIVSTDPNEIYGDEEEALEPEVTPPGSSRNLWLIVGLVVLILVLVGGIGWYYYNHSEAKANKDSADLAYVNELTTYYNEYVQAQQDYFTALNNQFASYEDTATHAFTEDDITAIRGATDMFEQRGEAALDSIIAIEAPSDKAKAQKEVVATAEEVKKTVLPASLQAQRDIKKGSTLQDFIDNSEEIYSKRNDDVVAVFTAFQEALANAGVEMSSSTSGE